MARPKKIGLDYFPFDVDFFLDQKIKRLRARFGRDGIVVYLYILCEIYRNGYYIDYNEDLILDISDELNISENCTMQIMNYLFSRSLLDGTLAKSVKVLTASSIQRRYQEAKKNGKTDIYVDARFWVLKKEETHSFIKVRPNDDYSENNECFSENNSNKSEKNDTKESKVKKSKVEESKEYMPEAKAPDSTNFINLPLNDKSEFSVTENMIFEWAELYPAVDIKQELRKMKGWLDSNPTRRKTKSGIKRFITNWLAKSQDSGGNKKAEKEYSFDLDEYKVFINDFGDEESG